MIMRKTLLTLCTLLSSLYTFAQTDWAGTYTLRSNDPLLYTETIAEAGLEISETFEIVITKQDDKYVVSKFMGYDLTASVDGVLELELDGQKEGVAYIESNRHRITSKYYEYEEENTNDETGETSTETVSGYEGILLLGNNMSSDPIKLTKQSDGQIKMSNFVLMYASKATQSLLGWFDKNTPLNGGDPDEEVVPYAWAGTYLVVTDGVFTLAEDVDCPEVFMMTIEEDMWNPGSFVVTEFWGHDDLAMTNFFTGGLPLTLDAEDGDKCYLPVAAGQNLLAVRDDMMSYYALTDGFGLGTENVALTHNADDTFTIDMFSINTYGYAEDFVPETIAMYFGATAEKGDREALQAKMAEIIAEREAAGVKSVENTQPLSVEYFDLNGHRLSTPQKGISIVRQKQQDGSVVTRKVVTK